LFIADEVQTAWGRTGEKWFGIEHWNVEPDVMVSAKGMGNGAPVAMTIATPEVADQFPGTTFATFGGNPVSMTAALATLQVIEEEDLKTNAKVVGACLRKRLEALAEQHPLVGDVRGMGLMQGLELVKDRKTKEPAPQAVLDVMEETRRRGVLVGKGGLYGNVLRLAPHLNATQAHVDEMVEALDHGLAFAARK
jgi:4-aminobutyrate aminotransferase